MSPPEVDDLLAARERLRQRSEGDVLAVLAGLVEQWIAPRSSWRRQAAEIVAAETGLSTAMLNDGLPRIFEPLRGDAIARLLDAELGAARAGCLPRLVVHVLPGNVPGLAVPAMCLSLALRAATIIKPAAEERGLAPLFARSLAEIDADLGACVAVRYWHGGTASIEESIFAAADAVEVSGSDQAVEAIRTRVRGRFVGRGARMSVAAIGREVLADSPALDAALAALAEDTAIWEQRGCLSPQAVLVEASSPRSLDDVAERLLAALAARAELWPPRQVGLDEKSAMARFRQAVEWGLNGEGRGRIANGRGGTVAVAAEAGPIRPTCLNRTLRLQPIADLTELAAMVGATRPRIEAVGLAVGGERFVEASRELREAGAVRVCAVGEMQRPDLTWKPGGLPRVRGWIG